MNRRARPSFVVLASLAVVVTGCAVAGEEKIVRDFFRASRLRDTATLGTFATATFDPRRDGQVQSFTVEEIGPERSTPVPVTDYYKAIEAAKLAQSEFAQQKLAYQNANIRAIERVVEAERRQKPISRQDAGVQTAWAKWRSDAAQHARALSEANAKLRSTRGIVELSLSRPNGPTPDITKLQGDLIEKDITVKADVRTPDGQSVQKTLVLTLVRAVMREGNGEPTAGRWIVRRIRSAGSPPTT